MAFLELVPAIGIDVLSLYERPDSDGVSMWVVIVFFFPWFIPAAALLIALGVAARRGLRRPGPLRGATG